MDFASLREGLGPIADIAIEISLARLQSAD